MVLGIWVCLHPRGVPHRRGHVGFLRWLNRSLGNKDLLHAFLKEPSWVAAKAAALRCCVAVELRPVEGREADLRRPEARVEDGRRGHLVGVRGRVRGRVRFRARFRARARGWGER